MINVYALKINKDIEKEEFDILIGYVSDDKKERIRRFDRFHDAQRSLFGDILARYAICKRTGVNNKNLVFRTNEFGKPILLEPHGIHFNIAHSGNWVVCAVDLSPIGVDVETIKPIDLKIAEKFFSRDEYIKLLSQRKEIQLTYFYKLWTLKESYIKAEGRGLNIPLDSFTIEIRSHSIEIYTNNEIKKYSLQQSLLDSNSLLAICSLNNEILESRTYYVSNFIEKIKTHIL